MFDWLRRKRKDGKARWSQVLGARQEEYLESVVNARLAAMGESAVVKDGCVRIGETTCGLENLAQVCGTAPGDEWPVLVERHFDALQRSSLESAEWEQRKHEFDWIAPQLCVRLYAEDLQTGDGTRIIVEDLALVRHDLPQLRSVLVADRPSTIVTVQPETTALWGRSPDQLFALALANLAERFPVDVETVQISDESATSAFVLSGEHLFVASHALRLDAWPQLVGAHGTLFCVPNRHTVLAYPIESVDLIDAIKAMAWIGHNAFVDGPGSIAPHLYWRTRAGLFAVMQVVVDDKSIGLTPSDEFKALLEALAG